MALSLALTLGGVACGDDVPTVPDPMDSGTDGPPADVMAPDADGSQDSGVDADADSGRPMMSGLDERPANDTCHAPDPFALPSQLSQTGCFDADDPTIPMPGLIPFDLNAALWSDGADKLRWAALPNGRTVEVMPDGDFQFPNGTVLLKTFLYEGVRLETRLLIRQDNGEWFGIAYQWNEAQTDADLVPAGPTDPFVIPGVDPPTNWQIPSREQCLECHQGAARFSLGPELGQLNRDTTYPSTGRTANQLVTWEAIGMFSAPLEAPVIDLPLFEPYVGNPDATTDEKVRSYVHINCSFCHRPGGAGRGPDDFRHTIPAYEMNVCNEAPTRGDLGITGALIVAPGDPDRSTMLQRMLRLDETRMPPVASAVVDPVGTGLVRSWILSLTQCPTP